MLNGFRFFLTHFLIFSVIKLCYILIYIVSLIFSRSCEKEFKANFFGLLVRAFAHDAIGRRIDPIELFLVPVSAPQRPWYVLSCLHIYNRKE